MRTYGKCIDKKLRNGIVSIFILISIKNRKTYPYAILMAFRKSHYEMLKRITKNEVYNTLSSLERKGLLKHKNVSKKDTIRKQNEYVVTNEGLRVVNESKKLFLSYLEEAKKLMRELE
jgi:DNA-binding PadR family transcriptional regulator